MSVADLFLHIIFSWWFVLFFGLGIALKKHDDNEFLSIVVGTFALSGLLYILR